MRFVFLSTVLFLTTICRAQEQLDLVSTTTSAIAKQYATELHQAANTIEKKSRQALVKLGISREYLAPTAVLTKILLEQKIGYRHRFWDTYYVVGESVDRFTGIKLYLTTKF